MHVQPFFCLKERHFFIVYDNIRLLYTCSALVNPSRDHENNRQLLVHFVIHTHLGSRIAQNGG